MYLEEKDVPKICEKCSFAVCDGFATYCPFCKHKNGDHKNIKLIKDCPLQPLTDYTKQVRKEVVQEIRERAELFGVCKTGILKEEYRIDKDVLNEIEQGENDAKD